MAMSVTYVTVHGRLREETRGGVTTRYLGDTLGSVIKTTDTSGNVTSTTTYWPFGEVRSQTGTNPSPWGFCGVWGYLTDAVSRMYVRARHYRADTSRWLTVDPWWPLQSGYCYASNQPSTFSDPSGLYESGPGQGDEWPRYFPREGFPLGWRYGNYCGKTNWKRGCDRPVPITCVDYACREHDDCLGPSEDKYWTPEGTDCNCKLLEAALWCYRAGSCSYSRFTTDCQASRDIIATFWVICKIGPRRGWRPESTTHPIYVPRSGDLPGGPPPGANIGSKWNPIYV